ncbi:MULTISPECIES: AAA family ATPase [unclassified Crossiella]|uniref:AAA family ATPase n=1 Tax=unclassified Crossiella TaxID=2620835 RepID=UPI00200032F4|nr:MULTISPECIES: AAA family ATPase [unclassified Crossiella]MCK2237233.1 AAA family ATPase [Crossiella sp. S99.2]MCK2250888.1 AAA family ATPase [Crossiella sp. S99.1]
MTERLLRKIEIEGFTSIKSASVELGRLNVLVGANGAGKSNFIRALELLHGCHAFHFHDAAVGTPPNRLTPTADNLTLHRDGRNLAAVLMALRDHDLPAHAAAYDQIVTTVQLVAPFVRDFVLEPDESHRVQFRWRQQGSDVVLSGVQMSDGTLRFICLATLLSHPELPALVALDEPELGLHPFALVQLADLLRAASIRSQVLIATQSVTLMNQFAVEEVVVVEREGGSSRFHRPDPAALRIWLEEYTLGEIWEKNLIGGRPANEGASAQRVN